jgi:hypothetical protein
MWKRPYYADAHENLPFDSFLKKQWRSYVDLNRESMRSFGSNEKIVSISNCKELLGRVKMVSTPDSICTHSNRSYSCRKIPERNAFSGEHSRPSINCLTKQESDLVCQNGEYLCLVGTRIRMRECNEHGRQFLLQVGGLCRMNDTFFECVPDTFEQGYVEDGAMCLTDRNLCHDGYILCEQGSRRVKAGLTYPSTSNRKDNQVLTVPECAFLAHAARGSGPAPVLNEIGGMCRHAGKFFRCTLVPNRVAEAGNLGIPETGCLSGDESASICHDGGHLCDHDIRFARDPPYIFMVPLLPCHPRGRVAVQAEGGACIFDHRVYVCQQWPNHTVNTGTEASPSPLCKAGAESWGICDNGSFLCEDVPAHYPQGSSRHGIPGQYVPRCDIWPTDELGQIGALCRYGGKNYACTHFPGKYASFADSEAPYVRCLSGHQSSQLCQHGKYLCEDGVRFETAMAGNNDLENLPQCDRNARDKLMRFGSCVFDGQEYTCERIHHKIVASGLESSPIYGCKSGTESWGLCLKGKFLCLKPPDCFSELEASQALAKIGGTCKIGNIRYNCQDVRGSSVESGKETNQSSFVVPPGCLSHLRHLCSMNFALCSHQMPSTELYPHTSNRHNIPNATIPSCENGAKELKSIGGQCRHMGKNYMCFSFAGRVTTIIRELSSPSDMCLSGDESRYLCNDGKYLCESSAFYNFISAQGQDYASNSKQITNSSLGSHDNYQVQGLPCNSSSHDEQPVPYPRESSRFGILGLLIERCCNITPDELSEIGAMCRHRSINYGCTLILGRKSKPGEIEAPHQRCFPGDESSRVCNGGRYLCENWNGYQWRTSDGEADYVPQCGVAALTVLAKNGSCNFNGQRYSCQRVLDRRVTNGMEPRPSPLCRAGAESWGLCMDGMFLCSSHLLEHACPCDKISACMVACNEQFPLHPNELPIEGNDLHISPRSENHEELLEDGLKAELKLHFPLPCDLMKLGEMWELNKTCIFEKEYFMCKSVPGFWVQDGTEPRPSSVCRTGAESWGLCDKGNYLCEVLPELFPDESSRHGIAGQYVHRCDSRPVNELREIGSLCTHHGRSYSCVAVPGRSATASDQQSPDARCFSGDQSFQLCQDGMYLCEHWQSYPWSFHLGQETELSCKIQCGETARHLLTQNGSCFFGKLCYKCERLRYHQVESGLEASPFSRCRSGAESKGLCLDGKFLCSTPTDCNQTVEAAQALSKIGGVCKFDSNHFSCEFVRNNSISIFNQSDAALVDGCLFLFSGALCPVGHALCMHSFERLDPYPFSSNRHGILGLTVPTCERSTGEMREIGSLCEHMGKKFQCIYIPGWSSEKLGEERPSIWCLSGDESSRICINGKYLCQDWVFPWWQLISFHPNDFPPCSMSLISSIRAAGSLCSFQEKVYSCRSIKGRYVHTGLEQAPGAICRNGAESWNLCTEGMFLCESIPSCAGAAGFNLADLGGMCWSDSGYHQCLSSEHVFGEKLYDLNTSCNDEATSQIICGEAELLCLVNSSNMHRRVQRSQVLEDESECPLNDVSKLRMIGGKCNDAAEEYECKLKDFECSPTSKWKSEYVSTNLKLCGFNHVLCKIQNSSNTNSSILVDQNSTLTICNKYSRSTLSLPGGVCYHQGKTFTCKKIPGFTANKQDTLIHFRGCKSGFESSVLCIKGRYFCESHLSYPWEGEIRGSNLAEFEEQKDR